MHEFLFGAEGVVDVVAVQRVSGDRPSQCVASNVPPASSEPIDRATRRPSSSGSK